MCPLFHIAERHPTRGDAFAASGVSAIRLDGQRKRCIFEI
jgi:hypothetical protein